METIIDVKNVTFTYLHRRNPALKNINFQIKEGEFISLIGPLGAGKSTLLYALNGVVPNHFTGKLEGDVLVKGKNTREHKIVDLANDVTLVVEDPQIQIFNLTVEDDVAFGPINLKLPADEIEKRVNYALKALRLDELRKSHPRELSGGQQQRVALAGALAMRPSLIALDEPISMLDPIGKREVLDAISDLNKKYGIACIISESGSDIESVINMSTRVLVMDKSELILDGDVHEALKDDLFDRLGVGLPQVANLFLKMRQKFNLDISTPATIDEAIDVLQRLIDEKKIKIKKELAELQSLNNKGQKLNVKNLHKGREPILVASNVWYQYPNGTVALKGVGLKLYPGELVAFIGQNGSGKSTLALTLAGAMKPTNNDSLIMIGGQEISKIPHNKRITLINYVFQNPDNQLFSSKVLEEISFALKMIGKTKKDINEATKQVMEELGLTGIENKLIINLTKDLKTLVALASVYVLKPKILLVDEPTGGLDRKTASKLMEVFVRLKKAGNSIAIITHDMRLVYEFADRVIVLHNGRILLDGPTGSVFANHEILRRAFIVPPQMSRLAAAFSKYGISPTTYLVDEMLKYMEGGE